MGHPNAHIEPLHELVLTTTGESDSSHRKDISLLNIQIQNSWEFSSYRGHAQNRKRSWISSLPDFHLVADKVVEKSGTANILSSSQNAKQNLGSSNRGMAISLKGLRNPVL